MNMLLLLSVCLESKQFFQKQNQEIKQILDKDLRKSFDNLVKDVEIPVQEFPPEYGKLFPRETKSNTCFGNNSMQTTDQQILQFYRYFCVVNNAHKIIKKFLSF